MALPKKKSSITFRPGKFKLGKDSITLTFPKKLKTIFNSRNNKFYWAQVGPTLQLICDDSFQPTVPIMTFSKNDFVAH